MMDQEQQLILVKARLELERQWCIPSSNDIDEMTTCCVFFINRFCYTFNPKAEPYHFRFKLYPFQETLVRDLIQHIVSGEDLFIDKCREMGATYTTVGVFLWFWMFIPGSNFLVGSRNEKFVDSTKEGSEGTNKEESIFGKMEYMLSRIYQEVLPEKFDLKKHLLYMSLINPELGNVISGESSNPNFSRGGRQKAILMDEFAFWDNDSAAWGSTADTTRCRIVLTTPGIRPSKAKRLRFGEDGEKIRVISLAYDLDPRKDATWLEGERNRRSREDFSREIMIDWQGSLTGVVYPEIAYAERGDYPYDPRWPLYASWDFGLDGVSIIWVQKNLNTGKIRVVDYYENQDKVIQFYYPMVGKKINPQFASQYTVDDIAAIRELKPLQNPIHYGDPDVAKRSLIVESSTSKELAMVGIHVLTNRMSNDFASRREQTKLVLQDGIEINTTKRTARWLLCMENARYPQRTEGSQATTAVNLPIHDWSSHGRTAFEYFCVNYRNKTGNAPDGGVIRAGNPVRDNYLPAFPSDNEGRTTPPDILELTKASLPKRLY